MLLWSVRLDFTSRVCIAMLVYSRLKSFPLFPTVHCLDRKESGFLFFYFFFFFNILNEKLQRPKGCFVVVLFPSCCEGGKILGRFYSPNKHLGLRCSFEEELFASQYCIFYGRLTWRELPHKHGDFQTVEVGWSSKWIVNSYQEAVTSPLVQAHLINFCLKTLTAKETTALRLVLPSSIGFLRTQLFS